MLSLSLMKAFFNTVGSESSPSSPIIEEILSFWEHDPGSQMWASASSNIVCGFRASGMQRVLRVAVEEPSSFGRHSTASVEAELEFIHWLDGKGLPVAVPIPSLSGKWFEHIHTALGWVNACVFNALTGESCDFEDLPPSRWTDWGRAIGSFHNAVQGYRQPGHPAWSDHLEYVAATLPPGDRLAQEALSKLRVTLQGLPVTAQNFGLLHSDLCPDNIFWTKAGPALIDFDDAAYGWFAADIACALPDRYSGELLEAVLSGYRSVRPLSPSEAALIPVFQIENHLVKYVELLSRADEGLEPGEPEWTQRIRRKLRSKLATYRAEFEAWEGQLP